ncbi:hypothetical protein ACSVDM_10685 [Nocardia sp. JW2]|uniref:hypothetical protein n=1 Tax=Nocardia sp. JW2 TaxID=3450738 RepID=UPI003F43C5D3
MKSTIAAVTGFALITLAQLHLAAPASACGPYPVPCEPSSGQQVGDFLSRLAQTLLSGSSAAP